MKIQLYFLLVKMECRARKVCSGTPSLVSNYTSHMMTAFSKHRAYFPHHRNFLAGNLGEKKSFLASGSDTLAMVGGLLPKKSKWF